MQHILTQPPPTIGVLALQGAFREHADMLARAGARGVEVRKAQELDGLDGLVIPGGESTAMGLIAQRWGLVDPLRAWVHSGHPTWGTCAGMILLAERASGQKEGGQPLVGGLDVTVNRNHFGRQLQSFETQLDVPALGSEPVHAVFIRAPGIVSVGEGVEILARFAEKEAGGEIDSVIVAVRQGPLLATAFHPELTDDLRWHEYFVSMVRKAQADLSGLGT